jgi:hypothetical protein
MHFIFSLASRIVGVYLTEQKHHATMVLLANHNSRLERINQSLVSLLKADPQTAHLQQFLKTAERQTTNLPMFYLSVGVFKFGGQRIANRYQKTGTYLRVTCSYRTTLKAEINVLIIGGSFEVRRPENCELCLRVITTM